MVNGVIKVDFLILYLHFVCMQKYYYYNKKCILKQTGFVFLIFSDLIYYFFFILKVFLEIMIKY